MTGVVAIDGPGGAGKSTVARGVADALGLPVLDTGAMYRAVTLAALEAGVDPDDADAMTALARRCRVEVDSSAVLLDGRDVSAAIRSAQVTATVSTVSAHPEVRRVLVARQREWVERRNGGVVEGRDIGTVVFPDAAVKVFLTASGDERARRRARESPANGVADEAAVREALNRRDALDSGRATSPLRAAADALAVDTTDRAVDDVVAEIVATFRERS